MVEVLSHKQTVYSLSLGHCLHLFLEVNGLIWSSHSSVYRHLLIQNAKVYCEVCSTSEIQKKSYSKVYQKIAVITYISTVSIATLERLIQKNCFSHWNITFLIRLKYALILMKYYFTELNNFSENFLLLFNFHQCPPLFLYYWTTC